MGPIYIILTRPHQSFEYYGCQTIHSIISYVKGKILSDVNDQCTKSTYNIYNTSHSNGPGSLNGATKEEMAVQFI